MSTTTETRKISSWMRRNVSTYTDPITGAVDCTKLVEAWDGECAGGSATLDQFHPAWDVAVEVAEEHERAMGGVW